VQRWFSDCGKIYPQSEAEELGLTSGVNKVSRKGDVSFRAAKMDFFRLQNTFPLPLEVEKEMITQFFTGSALRIANEVARENPDAPPRILWQVLESKLFKNSHQTSQNAVFLQSQWNERKETLEEYAERVHAVGNSLEVSEDLMFATFIKGLPSGLLPFAYSVNGNFDEVTTVLKNISDSDRALSYKSGIVKEVRETSTRLENPTGDSGVEFGRGAGGVTRTCLDVCATHAIHQNI